MLFKCSAQRTFLRDERVSETFSTKDGNKQLKCSQHVVLHTWLQVSRKHRESNATFPPFKARHELIY